MYQTIGKAALALALAVGGSTMLGGTAFAAPSPAQAHHIAAAVSTPSPAQRIGPVSSACYYTIYWNGFPIVFPCPTNTSSGTGANGGTGGTATNNCNANCSATAKGGNSYP